MNNFLSSANSALKILDTFNKVYVIIGNESCDLDSAVSALIYGYYLYCTHNTNTCCGAFIPVLNIQEDEFPLRTETKYFLQKLNICTTKLIFRNNINLQQLAEKDKLQLILVDHHVLPLHDKILETHVIEIIDHRPIDKNSSWNNILFIISTVGSCTTLIANIIFENKPSLLDNVIAKLLHGTIILDTINFNESANRFSQLDLNIVSKLEQTFEIDYSREDIYNELTVARSNVSNLTTYQILQRDMKIINGLPFLGVPMLISEFLELPHAVESFKKFCNTKKYTVLIVMGLATKNNEVFREIGVYSLKDCELQNKIINFLMNNTELGLTKISKNICELNLFFQSNVKASRKHIVPMLTPVIESCEMDNTIT